MKIPRAFKIELAVMVDENDAQQAFLGMPSCLLSILAWFCLLLRCTCLDATLPTTKLSHSHVIRCVSTMPIQYATSLRKMVILCDADAIKPLEAAAASGAGKIAPQTPSPRKRFTRKNHRPRSTYQMFSSSLDQGQPHVMIGTV